MDAAAAVAAFFIGGVTMALRIDILTLFPEMFIPVLGTSIPKRAADMLDYDGEPQLLAQQVTVTANSETGTLAISSTDDDGRVRRLHGPPQRVLVAGPAPNAVEMEWSVV